jgi:hypothetical protein
LTISANCFLWPMDATVIWPALASQFGRVEIVRLLLDAGEDPNR